MTEDAFTRWVRRLNELGRKLDEDAAVIHPSAWHDLLAEDMEKYRKLAAGGPKSLQLELPLFEDPEETLG